MMPGLRTGDFIFASRWDFGFSPRSFIASASSKPAFGVELPERGDVVVFSSTSVRPTNYVKRVIGLPGETIEIVDGIVSIDGVAAIDRPLGFFTTPETKKQKCVVVEGVIDQRFGEGSFPYCRFDQAIETLPGADDFRTIDIANTYSDNYGPTVIPEDHVFVMGDNRDDSLDSRYAEKDGGVGMVPVANLMGKVRFIVGRDEYGVKFIGSRPVD